MLHRSQSFTLIKCNFRLLICRTSLRSSIFQIVQTSRREAAEFFEKWGSSWRKGLGDGSPPVGSRGKAPLCPSWGNVQIPLGGPDQTLSETRVYDLVSDKVRGLCLVVDFLSISTCTVFFRGSGRVADKVCGSTEFRNDTTRPDQRYFSRT